MSKKSLLVLIVVAVLTGLIVLVLNRPATAPAGVGKAAPGARLLGDVDLAAVAALTVQSGEATVTLKRGADKKWAVAEREGVTADASRLSEVLSQLAEIKIAQVQQAGPSQYPRLQLADPAATGENAPKNEEKGTLVKLLDEKDAPIAQIVLGKSPQSSGPGSMSMFGGSGRFVRTVGNETQVVLVGDSLSQLTAAPADWISKTFLQPGSLKRIAVAGPEGFQPWEVARDKAEGQFVLKDPPAGKQLSQTASGAWSSLLSYAQPTDILVKAEVGKLDKKETRTLTLENFDGRVFTLTLTPLPKDAPKPGEDADAAASGQGYYAVQAAVTGTFTPAAPPPPPVKPVAPAADANDEARKKFEEEQKAYDEAMKAHGEAVKAHGQSVATARKAWDDQLAKDQALGKHVFKFSSYTFDSVWKTRDEIVENIPPPPEPATPEPPAALTPEGAPVPPAPSPAAGAGKPAPISVTTPPIAVPPATDPAKDDPKAPQPDPAPVDKKAPPVSVTTPPIAVPPAEPAAEGPQAGQAPVEKPAPKPDEGNKE